MPPADAMTVAGPVASGTAMARGTRLGPSISRHTERRHHAGAQLPVAARHWVSWSIRGDSPQTASVTLLAVHFESRGQPAPAFGFLGQYRRYAAPINLPLYPALARRAQTKAAAARLVSGNPLALRK